MQPPIRCLVASGERQIIRVEAESVYRIDAGAGDISMFQLRASQVRPLRDTRPLAWVPIRGKEYLMTISVSLTSPDATRQAATRSPLSRDRAAPLKLRSSKLMMVTSWLTTWQQCITETKVAALAGIVARA